jgi:hypothetical protein
LTANEHGAELLKQRRKTGIMGTPNKCNRISTVGDNWFDALFGGHQGNILFASQGIRVPIHAWNRRFLSAKSFIQTFLIFRDSYGHSNEKRRAP